MSSKTLDSELEARFRDGDPGAFAELMRGCEGRLVAYLKRNCFGLVEAEDIAQEVWLNVWTRHNAFTGNFWGFVRLYATRRLIDRQRKAVSEAARREEFVESQTNSQSLTSADMAERRAFVDELLACIGKVGGNFASVLKLQLQDLSRAEIAERLQITVEKVYKDFHRAKKAVKSCLHAKGFIDDSPRK